jgi:alpha-glucosidase
VHRRTYLPAGASWVHFWSGAVHEGGQTLAVDCPFGAPPVFWRDGSPAAEIFRAVAAEAAA